MILSTFEMFKNADYGDKLVTLDDEQLHNLQDMLKEMTNDIIEFCKRHNLRVFLGGGSCLGALRHKDVIPWDDDVDLMMLRKDYNRFMRLFPKEMGDKYWVHSPQLSLSYESLFMKVLKKGTVARAYEDIGSDECGVSVDIFPIENTYDDRLRYYIHGAGCILLSAIVSCRRIYKDYDNLKVLFKGQSRQLNVLRIKAAIGFLLSKLSLRRWLVITDRWYKQCRDESTENCSVPTGRERFFRATYPRQYFENMNYVPFGEYFFPIVNNADKYMENLYGNYMEIPPENKREKHTYLEFDLGE